MTASSRFRKLSIIQGWSESTRLRILLEFLDEHADGNKFMLFAEAIAEIENEVGARREDDADPAIRE